MSQSTLILAVTLASTCQNQSQQIPDHRRPNQTAKTTPNHPSPFTLLTCYVRHSLLIARTRLDSTTRQLRSSTTYYCSALLCSTRPVPLRQPPPLQPWSRIVSPSLSLSQSSRSPRRIRLDIPHCRDRSGFQKNHQALHSRRFDFEGRPLPPPKPKLGPLSLITPPSLRSCLTVASPRTATSCPP